MHGTCGYANDLQWSLPGTLRVSQLSGCGDLTTFSAWKPVRDPRSGAGNILDFNMER